METTPAAEIAKIEQWSKLIFRNAEQLYEEAQLLGGNRAFARAVALHQLSIEECSKIDLLGAAAMSFALGEPVDLPKLIRSMSRHETKNRANAYFSVMGEEERAALESGNHQQARDLFKKQQKTLHQMFNDQKNAALYTDFVDGRWVAPDERISETNAVEMQQLNAFFLKHGANHLRLLERLVEAPIETVAPLEDLWSRLRSSMNYTKMDEAIVDWTEEHASLLAEQKAGRGVPPLG